MKKIGLSMSQDISASSKAVGVEANECKNQIDIQTMLKAKKGKNKSSLSDLVHEHLGQPLEKQC